MAALDDLASKLFGSKRAESNIVSTDATTRTYVGTATSASEDGSVYVALSQDVTLPDDDDGEHGIGVEMPTTVGVSEGDEVIVTLMGGGTMKSPVVTGNPGWGDSIQTQVDNAETLAQQAEAVVEQVRQDVADFRSDVATTYATKVEREDGDDAVKTWVTTNYTNSNDLATTYATKTLVSQTKDAIELAASQTYETQSDAAATYATKSALTVGLDGIRTEVAEDYQPKGDYATTASMNSAIQQSASSIESSVAATYETKSDAAATYATKTEVQQTASGLDTRITTAQSTADGAASTAATASSNATAALNKVDGLQVGGTNLMLENGIGLWPTAYCFMRSNLSEPIESGVPYVLQLWDVDVSNSKKTAAQLGVYVYYCGGNVRIGGWQGTDYFTNGHADHLTLHFTAYTDKVTTSSGGNVSANLNLSHSSVTSADPKNIQLYNSPGYVSGAVMNCTIGSWKLERGTVPTDWSPAPEDMATEADLQAEVTERQTLIRQFGGGVLAGYVGNAIAALVNAAGSFDVVRTAWSGGVPSILGTLARYAASGISLFDAAGNVLAEFASDHVRIGGDVPDGTGVESTVQFFDQTETHDTDMTASTYFDGASDYQTMQSTVNLSSTLADEGKAIDTGSSGTAALDLVNMLENGISATGEQHNEVHAALVADASYSDGATTSHAAVRATASTLNGSNLSYAELIADAIGVGTDEGSIDYVVMQQALVGLTQPSSSYTGANGTATASSNGWHLTYFNTQLGDTRGNPVSNYWTFSNGVITVLKDCLLEFSGVMNWTDNIVGSRGFGLFVGSTTAGSGTEHSTFQMFPSNMGTRKSVTLSPLLLPMSAGQHVAVGRYEQNGAVYVNGANYSWITIRVVEDRSS